MDFDPATAGTLIEDFDPSKAGTPADDFDPAKAGTEIDPIQTAQTLNRLVNPQMGGPLTGALNPTFMQALATLPPVPVPVDQKPLIDLPDTYGETKPVPYPNPLQTLKDWGSAQLPRGAALPAIFPFAGPIAQIPAVRDAIIGQEGQPPNIAQAIPRAVDAMVRGVATPTNAAISVGTAGLGELGVAGEIAQAGMKAYFVKEGLLGAAEAGKEMLAAPTAGEKLEAGTRAVLNAAMPFGIVAEEALGRGGRQPFVPDPITETVRTPNGVFDTQTGGPLDPVRAKSLEALAGPDATAPLISPSRVETLPQKTVAAFSPGGNSVEISASGNGPKVLSTALKVPDGPLFVGDEPNQAHQETPRDINRKPTGPLSVMDAHIAAGDEAAADGVPGFIVQDADGTVRFTPDRVEAGHIADAAGQREPTQNPDAPLHSQDLKPETLQRPATASDQESAVSTLPAPKGQEAPPPSELAAPVSGEPSPERPTGVRNSLIDADRADMGLPPRAEVLRLANPVAWDEAQRIIKADDAERAQSLAQTGDAGKSIGERMQDDLAVNPRALNPVETAIMGDRQLKLKDAVEEASKRQDDAGAAGDSAGVAQAKFDKAKAEDEYEKWADAYQRGATEKGRSLQANKMVANRDFTLASMLREERSGARSAKPGGILSKEELQKISDDITQKYKRISAAEKSEAATASARKERDANAAADAAAKEIAKEVAKEKRATRPKGKVQQFAEKALNALDQKAEAARTRMKGRGGSLFAGVDPAQAADIAIVAASKLAHAAGDVAKWTKSMIEEFGERIRPHLQKILASAKDVMESTSNLAEITGKFSKRASEGEPLNTLHPFIRSIAKEVYRGGAKGWEQMLNGTHEVVKETFPEITRNEVRDAWTGYDRPVRDMDRSDAARGERDVKNTLKKITDIERMAKGKAPKSLRPKPDEPSLENRTITRQRNEAKKLGGFDTTDPAKALKSSLDSIKTRLKNQIDELSTALSKREAIPQKTGAVAYDQEALDLRARRDELKGQYDDIFKKPGMTDEARLKIATDAAQRSAEKWDERLKNAQHGKFDDGTKRPTRQTSAQIDAIRAQRDAAKAEIEHLRAADSVQAELDQQRKLQSKIDAAGKAPRPKWAQREGPDTEATAALKTKFDALALQRDLASRKAAEMRKAADFKERLANQDFGPRPKRATPSIDKELLTKQAETASAKLDFQRGVTKYQLENRPWWAKAQDTFAALRRASVLTGFSIVEKLTAAATENILTHPFEEFAGTAVGKIPGIRDIAERAPIEGGANVRAMAKGVSDTYKHLFENIGDYLKTGHMKIDLAHGKPDVMPPRPILDLVGRIHGALKTPARQYQFTTAFEKQMDFAVRHGENPLDPNVQLKALTRAYEQANRSIFSDENILTKAYTGAVAALEREFNKGNITGSTTAGKAIATGLKVALPVVKIPTNIVARILEYSPLGAASGIARTAGAFAKGLENVPPEAYDSIFRNLKRGAIGTAVMAIGYYNPQMFGGYYTGKKEGEGQPQFGGAKIKGLPAFDIYGHHFDTSNVPRFLLHNPLLEQAQIGATIRRVADSYATKKSVLPRGTGTGVAEAAKGVAKETPFIGEAVRTGEALEPGRSIKASIGKELVPRGIAEIAEMNDKDAQGKTVQRNPKTFIQGVESELPFLRKTVPVKEYRESQRSGS
jgi:hypothetical protein